MHPSLGEVQPQTGPQLPLSLPPSKTFCSQEMQVSISSPLQNLESLAGSLLLP